MKALRRGITNALRSPRFYTKQFGFGKVFKEFLGLRCELAGLELQARLKGWRVVVGYGV
jgi:hypothetical protein